MPRRSSNAPLASSSRIGPPLAAGAAQRAGIGCGAWRASAAAIASAHASGVRKFGTPARLDRKSTRLNSSHLGISYAVFCLKKKKNSREQTKLATTRIHVTARPETTHREQHPTRQPHCTHELEHEPYAQPPVAPKHHAHGLR